MAQPKPLFVPWLYDQIKSRNYPGVGWTNEELGQFSIPWKHALRQDSNREDVLIFKAWAQTSASGEGRINGDHSVWKRNFRSALRAKGFTMIFDNKNDAANPHKVYQFPSEPHSTASGSEGSQDTAYSPDQYVEDMNVFPVRPSQGIEQDFTGLNLDENPPQVWNLEEIYLGVDDNRLFEQTSPAIPFTEILQYPAVAPAVPFPSAALGQVSPSEGPAAVNHTSPAYQTDGDGAVDQLVIPEPKLETFFHITVYYRGKMVFKQLVENDAGFRLIYKGNTVESGLMDDTGLTFVTIPPLQDIPDQVQAKFTSDILENLGGLEIRRLDGVIYGHRLGSSKIYWGLCKHERNQTPRELDKTMLQPLYYIKEYISGLMAFMQTGGESPSSALYFFLGEKWPDPKMKPWEKKLIMIEVALTSMEDLKKLAVISGASSLQSVELQLSLEQMMELC